jgi:hypothetical protein
LQVGPPQSEVLDLDDHWLSAYLLRDMVDLSALPVLEELRMIAVRGRPAPYICVGISSSIQRLVLDGPFELLSSYELYGVLGPVAVGDGFKAL